ncbi:hypothetical protein EVAR_39246_1 [Eumeta japonica]|uniref:Uncharacterized protein n=1 Tax=Eumeta variegata TaxID=151549 RepID=A0A4C1Y3R9_EUMVA|nr:hypothetical protein EVAR_39246_1 [Eumeta japonica]
MGFAEIEVLVPRRELTPPPAGPRRPPPADVGLVPSPLMLSNGYLLQNFNAHPQENADSRIHQGVRSVKNDRQMRSPPPHVIAVACCSCW